MLFYIFKKKCNYPLTKRMNISIKAVAFTIAAKECRLLSVFI